ncbi:MAG TPA: transporter [Candidatus Cloacimonas sp.]|jgi:phospholipid/cholesterol/gamma-HCH transport system permease protein|nr:transporter [Candidatus Cloacimonas sp.]
MKTKYILPESLDKNSVPQVYEQCSKNEDLLYLDFSRVVSIDSAGVALVDYLKNKIPQLQLLNISDSITETMQTFKTELVPETDSRKENYFERIGEKTVEFAKSFKEALFLTADISFWSFISIFNRKGHRKGAVVQQSLLIGVDALGIISLLSIILGLIIALQSAAQLRQFGANIFIADLIAIAMVREVGPMMTAIILAGRSGSAIASEIATMKVTEELDALRMMAINPVRYVMVPKFSAITICMPFLVIWSTAIGILGGLVIAVFYLDLSVTAYMTEIFEVLTLKDILVGLSKSIIFAWVIVIIGSYFGLNVEGGAEGVGKVTTKSVVVSIFMVIFFDVIFSLLYLGG